LLLHRDTADNQGISGREVASRQKAGVMGKAHYVARVADDNGIIRYTDEEHAIWAALYQRQRQAINGRACAEFIHGLDILQLPTDRVPQLEEVSRVLRRETGWAVAPVPALIPIADFFALLANRQFPAATFVRRREQFDYLQEPDIFHEIFGHAPLLTNPWFAGFTEAFGKLGLASQPEEHDALARLYWFTVEFGLIQPPGEDLRIYGGGILSSVGETLYALGPTPQRQRFNLLEALRTPYRIDIMQPLYFVLEDLRELETLARADVMASIAEASRLGLYAPLFDPAAPSSANTGAPKSMPFAIPTPDAASHHPESTL